MGLTPKVSIIIPVYNSEDYLRECIDSVLCQEEKRIELICIDDGSSDGSGKILEEYAAKDERVSVIVQKNQGLSATRNKGTSVAKGDYIQFLDSDDKLHEAAIKTLLDQAEEMNLDVLYFEGDTFFEEGFSDHKKYERYNGMYRAKDMMPQDVMSGNELFAKLNEIKSYRSSACMQFIRREFLLNCGVTFREGIYYEDNIFTLKTMTKAQRVAYCDQPLYLRRIRDNSIVTSAKTYSHYRSYVIAFAEMSQYALGGNLPKGVMPGIKVQLKSLIDHATAVYRELSEEDRLQAQGQYAEAEVLNLYADFGNVFDGIALQRTDKNRAVWLLAYVISKTKKVLFLLKTEGFASTAQKVLKKLKEIASRGKVSEYRASPRFESFKKAVWKEEGTPFVSVILPVYNGENYLQRTVKSLQEQTLKNAEFIFVDDGSTDRSVEILLNASKSDARIQVIRQENTNAGAARNRGLEHAKGEYVIFLDSDDTFDPDLLALAYDRAVSADAQVVMFDADVFMVRDNSRKAPVWMQQTKHLPAHVFAGKDAAEHLFQMLNPWTKLYKREYILSEGFRFQSQYSTNDAYFSIVALACAKRIAALPRSLVHYHVGYSTNIQMTKSRYPLNTYNAFTKAHQELEARGLLVHYQKPLAIKAAESMIREMDTLKTIESKKALYEVLHAGGLEELDFGLIEHDETAKKYLQNRLEHCQDILTMNWEEYASKHCS